MIQEMILKDLKEAMVSKNNEKRDLLRVVVGEMNRISKTLTDEQVLKIITKMKENATLVGNSFEVDILNEYLPSYLSYDETLILTREIITKNKFDHIKHSGQIIGALKSLSNASVINFKDVPICIKQVLSEV